MHQPSPLSTDSTYLNAAHLSLLVSFLPRHIKNPRFEFKVISSKEGPPALKLVKMQNEADYIKRIQQIYHQCVEQISNRLLFTEEKFDTLTVIKHPALVFELNKQGLIYVNYKPTVYKGFSAEFAIKLLGNPATTF